MGIKGKALIDSILANASKERGRFYELYTPDPVSAKQIGIPANSKVLRVGVPIWVKNGKGEYVALDVLEKGSYIQVKSGLASYNIYPDNKVEYFDSEKGELKATEQLSLSLANIGSVDLVKTPKHKKEDTPLRDGKGNIRKQGVTITKYYAIRKDGKDLGEFEISYVQCEGSQVRRKCETRGLPAGSSPVLQFVLNYPVPVDEIRISRENAKEIEKHKLESTPITIRNDKDIFKVEIRRQGNFWSESFLHANDKITYGSKNMLKEIQASNSEVRWVYSGLSDQLKLDFASMYYTNNPNEDGYVVSGSTLKYSGSPYMEAITEVPAAGSTKRSYFEWPIAPELFPARSIDWIYVVYDVALGDPNNIDFKQYNAPQPSATTDGAAIYGEIGNAGGVVLLSTTVNPTGPQLWIDLISATGDLFAKKANGWWAIGLKFQPEAPARIARIKTEEANAAANPMPELWVGYTT